MAADQLIIRAVPLYDGNGGRESKTIVVEGQTILAVTGRKYKADFSGVVTPGLIDAHSHIGMERQGEPAAESEADDTVSPFAPLLNPVDSIYFDDRAFGDAVDFGVLYSCVVPGSGNVVGGRAVVIRNFCPDRKTAVLSHHGYKMALGFNPRADEGAKGLRHNTRMGNAALLEKEFSKVIQKEALARIKRDRALLELEQETPADKARKKKWIQEEYTLALSLEERAVHELLTGGRRIKVHVHKEDDAFFLIDLKKRYGLNLTAEHALGIARTEVFDALADNDIPVVYGPLDSFDYKVELKTASYKHAARLMASRVKFGLMTDHPVILAHHLRDSLKYFLIQGMAPEKAISLVTRVNAEILNIHDRVGTIRPGMTASLVVWNQDPFHLAAFPRAVIAEGQVVRS